MNHLFGTKPVAGLRDSEELGPVRVFNAKTGEFIRFESATLWLDPETCKNIKKNYRRKV